jgi:hypothetical protein
MSSLSSVEEDEELHPVAAKLVEVQRSPRQRAALMLGISMLLTLATTAASGFITGAYSSATGPGGAAPAPAEPGTAAVWHPSGSSDSGSTIATEPAPPLVADGMPEPGTVETAGAGAAALGGKLAGSGGASSVTEVVSNVLESVAESMDEGAVEEGAVVVGDFVVVCVVGMARPQDKADGDGDGTEEEEDVDVLDVEVDLAGDGRYAEPSISTEEEGASGGEGEGVVGPAAAEEAGAGAAQEAADGRK